MASPPGGSWRARGILLTEALLRFRAQACGNLARCLQAADVFFAFISKSGEHRE